MIDDGSTDDTGAQAAAAGARVIRHPYNKGNGAAVKTGHPPRDRRLRPRSSTPTASIAPADAARLVARLDDYDLVVGARRRPHAGQRCARRIGNAALNRLASYLTEQPNPGSDVRISRGAPRAACSSSFICCRTASRRRRRRRWRSCKAGYSVAVRADRGGAAAGRSKIRLGADGVEFLPDPAESHHASSVRCGFSCRSAPPRSSLGAAYAVWTIVTQSHVTNSSVLLILLSVVIFLVGLVSEQISSLRFEGRRVVTPARRSSIVPDVQRARQPAACWSTALMRASPSVSVLVVDDDSPDGTGAVADELARELPGPHRRAAPHRQPRPRPVLRRRHHSACSIGRSTSSARWTPTSRTIRAPAAT